MQHGSVVSGYYGHEAQQQQSHGGGSSGNGGGHSPGKYQENGHDTFSDFVTLVCQEAQNTQNSQVMTLSFLTNEFRSERERESAMPSARTLNLISNEIRIQRYRRVSFICSVVKTKEIPNKDCFDWDPSRCSSSKPAHPAGVE